MTYKRSGLAILAVAFIGVAGGLSWLSGHTSYHGPLFRVLGAGLLLTAITVFAMTAHRWAGYLFAACALAAVKAALALKLGVTVSSGHLATNYPLVIEMFVMLVVLSALTVRFAYRVPRSKLEVFALLTAVVAVASQLLRDSNAWPVAIAVVLLAISWIVDRLTRRARSHHHHQIG